MASDKTSEELDRLAFDIYRERVARGIVNKSGEQIAVESYRKATEFLAAREKIRTGALDAEKPVGPQLCDCCAPNLHKTHPHNIVSQQMGDLAKVNRLKKWLDANPTPEGDPVDIVHRFVQAFPECQWGKDTTETLAAINTARAIFPHYCAN